MFIIHEESLSWQRKLSPLSSAISLSGLTLYEFAGEIPHIKPSQRFYHFRKSAKDENKLV